MFKTIADVLERTLTAEIYQYQRKGRLEDDDAAQTANVTQGEMK